MCNLDQWLYVVLQAAEQAKASPALVAKDPATSTTKKEEEDLAKGAPLRHSVVMAPDDKQAFKKLC